MKRRAITVAFVASALAAGAAVLGKWRSYLRLLSGWSDSFLRTGGGFLRFPKPLRNAAPPDDLL